MSAVEATAPNIMAMASPWKMGSKSMTKEPATTAAAVVAGSFVMLFDPIFQGLAIAMMFGAVASTALTLIVVPLMYYQIFRGRQCPEGHGDGCEDPGD